MKRTDGVVAVVVAVDGGGVAVCVVGWLILLVSYL